MNRLVPVILLLILLPASVEAVILYRNTRITNSTTSGHYNLTDILIEVDVLTVNKTHIKFTNLAPGYKGCWNYDTIAKLCEIADNCILAHTNTIINITFTLDTAPNVTWIDPTANGTETLSKSYILWNVSVYEDINTCFIELNGTNQTGTQVDAGVNSYCYYNQTGFSVNETHCAIAWANDINENMNRTTKMICRNTNFPAAPPRAGPSPFANMTPGNLMLPPTNYTVQPPKPTLVDGLNYTLTGFATVIGSNASYLFIAFLIAVLVCGVVYNVNRNRNLVEKHEKQMNAVKSRQNRQGQKLGKVIRKKKAKDGI